MPIKTTHDLFKSSFSVLGAGIEYMLKGYQTSKTGAQFVKNKDVKEYLSPKNTGLLIDGYSRRLSEEVSFQNVAVYGVTGTGKSSAFVRPNIFDKADRPSVIVVNDMSGDLYREDRKSVV